MERKDEVLVSCPKDDKDNGRNRLWKVQETRQVEYKAENGVTVSKSQCNPVPVLGPMHSEGRGARLSSITVRVTGRWPMVALQRPLLGDPQQTDAGVGVMLMNVEKPTSLLALSAMWDALPQ